MATKFIPRSVGKSITYSQLSIHERINFKHNNGSYWRPLRLLYLHHDADVYRSDPARGIGGELYWTSRFNMCTGIYR